MIFSKPEQILVPSRSDGIEVSLVSMPEQEVVKTYVPQVKSEPAPIKTLDTPADVNIKQTTTPTVKPQEAPVVKPVIKPEIKPEPIKKQTETKQPLPSESKTKKETVSKKAQINDLLGDVLSDNSASVRKGKALGGNPNGTSDTDNLIGNYADQVINAVRPFVVLPDNLNANAKAIIKVELYPNLHVKSATLIKSSGNPQYDKNVQDAIMRVKIFPSLPDGTKFVDYRILKLTFRP
ncbi:MAG: TonB C-terminal domain-containing protein [Burkholderiales bacterium]|nr:TonB C-terminal domain-containing protein [Burkholderiales bacterium]